MRSFLLGWLLWGTAFASVHADEQPASLWRHQSAVLTNSLYPHLQKETFFFSPLSLQMALSMCAELAYGETREELIIGGGLIGEDAVRHAAVQGILGSLTGCDAEGKEGMLLSNGAWLSQEMTFKPEVEALLTGCYRAMVCPADFINHAEPTREAINFWVESNTFGRIVNFLPQGSVNRGTRLVLVNTLYMKAPWKETFDPNRTYRNRFYGSDHTGDNVEYMNRTGMFGVATMDHATVVEFPFQEPKGSTLALSLFAILPEGGWQLADLEASLTADKWKQWMQSTSKREVEVHLPKFKISTSVDAKQLFKKAGMIRPFTGGAEFDIDGNGTGLAIDQILHQANFEIDEKGGTGSAATAIIFTTTSCGKCWRERLVVNFNRPFLIAVAEKTTGAVLFIGRVAQLPIVD